MPDLTCDVAIIGAGTAGIAAERAARKAGARTLLIDPAFDGTTCAHVGCMPSKLLIAAGNAAHAARRADVFGIRLPAPEIDGRAVMARVRRLRDGFVRGVLDGLEALPDGTMVRGRARFTSATSLSLDDGRTIDARAIVIATGAYPLVPEAFAGVRDRVLTNETLFEIGDLPRSLGVIGAGPLGLELAQAFARLGVEVAVFDKADGLGGIADDAIAGAMRKILGEEFLIRLGVDIAATPDGDGVRLRWQGEEQGEGRFDRLLVAAGRPPNLDGLDLAAAGLDLDDHGVPHFDPRTMRCGKSAVFIAGDADACRPVLHEASDEGAIAGGNAARLPDVTAAKRSTPLAIMFTDPSVAIVGDPGAEDAAIGTSDYGDQGRARTMATNRGLLRLVAEKAQGRLIGATIAVPGGEHIGQLLAWVIETGMTAAQMLEMPIYHPTYEEGLTSALREICATVGTTPPSDRDDGSPAGG